MKRNELKLTPGRAGHRRWNSLLELELLLSAGARAREFMPRGILWAQAAAMPGAGPGGGPGAPATTQNRRELPRSVTVINTSMGYTHFWAVEGSLSDAKWAQVKESAHTIVKYCNDKGIEFDLYGCKPNEEVFEGDIVLGRGDGVPGETFSLSRCPGGFRFCKTAREPYDLAVGLILMRTAVIAVDEFVVTSDGDWDREWIIIRNAYKEIFGDDPPCIFQDARMERMLEDRFPILLEMGGTKVRRG